MRTATTNKVRVARSLKIYRWLPRNTPAHAETAAKTDEPHGYVFAFKRVVIKPPIAFCSVPKAVIKHPLRQ